MKTTGLHLHVDLEKLELRCEYIPVSETACFKITNHKDELVKKGKFSAKNPIHEKLARIDMDLHKIQVIDGDIVLEKHF